MENPSTVPPKRRRGRGALSNQTNRFERFVSEAVDDGWARDEDLPPLRTTVSAERARRIITRNDSPDIPFDRSINPYRGCEHGCVYCFARPSHAYLGLSPGLDFETRLIEKPDAPAMLARELRAPRYQPAAIAIGTNTDAYQPLERDSQIMRNCLKVLADFQHPVAIATKGILVERDADILGPMGQAGLARVGISVTTLDAKLARGMEPRVPSPARRLRAIEVLAKAGCPVRVMVSPIIPGLTDHEVEAILQSARDAGAVAATMIVLRLPREVAPLMEEWLREAVPGQAEKVLARVRQFHGGDLYRADFGTRMTGQGVHSNLLRTRFRNACARLGLAGRLPELRCDLFRVPPQPGDQLSLF